MPSRASSDRFVGRARGLQQLEDALDAASAGEPRLLLVAAEAGGGKTRLVRARSSRRSMRWPAGHAST